MRLKLKEKLNHLLLSNALIDEDDYNLNINKLGTLAKNIKKEVNPRFKFEIDLFF